MIKSISVSKCIDLLNAIPDLAALEMCPSIFSGDHSGKHDCDTCRHHETNSGELYDPDVCRKCWTDAIKECGK